MILGRKLVLAVAVTCLAASSAACGAKAQARTAPDRQPLDVPPAPPRAVEPFDEVEVAAATASDNTAEGDPAATRPATRSARPPAAKTETPAPKAAEPARTDPEPRAAPPAAARLRTPQTADERETERAVRDLLARAGRQLGRVNYTRLSREGKAQYDTAKRFMAQCEDALKEKNFVFARYLADKADTLASQLVGR